MVKIELTKDKFGETITVEDINGAHSYAERNMTERKIFFAYLKILAGNKEAKFPELDLIEPETGLVLGENLR